MSLSFPASPSVGTVYQGWTWNGAAWDPNYSSKFVTSYNGRVGAVMPNVADVQSGNRVLVASVVGASPVTNLGLFYNFTTAYDIYELEGYGVQFTVEGSLFMHVSVDGSTFDASASYVDLLYFVGSSGNTVGGLGLAGQTYSQISTGHGSMAGVSLAVKLQFIQPGRADIYKYFMGDCATHGSTAVYRSAVGGAYLGNFSPLKGLQFYPGNGGNLIGTFNVYGIVK